MDQDASEYVRDILRSITRERFHDIWESAKAGNKAELNSEEQKLAQIMLQHKEEFHNQFEFADVMAKHKFIGKSKSIQDHNPYSS